MNRRERDDYGRYDGYDSDDAHYHRARNLTDEFERHYQRESQYRQGDQSQRHIPRSYHEGDMGDAYERFSRQNRDYTPENRNRDRYESFNPERDRYSNYRNEYDKSRDMIRQGRVTDQQSRGDRRQGYLLSEYDRTYGRYDELEQERSRARQRGYSGHGSSYSGAYSSPRRDYGDAGNWAGKGTNYFGSPTGNYGEDRDSTYSRNSSKYDRYRNRYY